VSHLLRIILNVILVVVVLAVAAGGAAWLLSHRREPPQSPPKRVVPVVVAPPLTPRTDHRVEIEGLSSVRPRTEVVIAPEVTGRIVERAANFFNGMYVREGQLLLRIDETDYRLAVQSLEEQIALTEADLQRLDREEENLKASEEIERQREKLAERKMEKIRRLTEAGAATENELDAATEALLARRAQLRSIRNQLRLIPPQQAQLEASLARTQVELSQARVNLQRCVIRSPVTGRVRRCDVEVGERVTAGAVCGEIYGTDVMELPVSVPAADLGWIDAELLEQCKRGEAAEGLIPARVRWSDPGSGRTETWEGCVRRVEAGLEAETRTATLVVCVANPAPFGNAANDKPMLDVNMFCRVIVLGKRLEKVFLLPRTAVLPGQEVYVVNDGRLKRRAVRVARMNRDEAMVLPGGGLEEGMRVVIGPVARPVPGMQVRAVDRLADNGEPTPTAAAQDAEP
jgi:RND family efflux transporter MFP subunit